MSEKKSCKSCNQNKQTESEFRQEPIAEGGGFNLKKKLGMVQNFAMSLTSRGLTNKKINRANKQLRVLSCFGNQHVGGELPPCHGLEESETDGKYYCGQCGCGDREGTWLMSDGDKYSKLDYPKLTCPLGMPGFTNYRMSDASESEEPVSRKYYAENIDYKELERLPVTTPEMSDEQKELMEKSRKMMMQKRQEEMQRRKEEFKGKSPEEIAKLAKETK